MGSKAKPPATAKSPPVEGDRAKALQAELDASLSTVATLATDLGNARNALATAEEGGEQLEAELGNAKVAAEHRIEELTQRCEQAGETLRTMEARIEQGTQANEEQGRALQEAEARIEALLSADGQSVLVQNAQASEARERQRAGRLEAALKKLQADFDDLAIKMGKIRPLRWQEVEESANSDPNAEFQLCVKWKHNGSYLQPGKIMMKRHYPLLISMVKSGMSVTLAARVGADALRG